MRISLTDISAVYPHSLSSPVVSSSQEPVLRCLIGAFSLPSFAFRWFLLLFFQHGSFYGGEIDAMGACLSRFDWTNQQKLFPTSAEAFSFNIGCGWRSSLSSRTLKVFHFQEKSVLFASVFFRSARGQIWSHLPYGFPQETLARLISPVFNTHSPSSTPHPPPIVLSLLPFIAIFSRALQRRPLQAQLCLTRVLLSVDSYQQRLSICPHTLSVSHISLVLPTSAYNLNGVWIPLSDYLFPALWG